jgi:hypothetical protein
MREYMMEYRNDIRDWFLEYKKTLKCERCGDSRWYVLIFHHKNPQEKEFEMSNFTKLGKSKRDVLNEIKKCLVLCHNCHVELHYIEKNNGFIRRMMKKVSEYKPARKPIF